MSILIENESNVIIIQPREPRLDVASGEELRNAFASVAQTRGRAMVLVDLEDVDYIDSVGLGSLVSGRLKLKGACDIRLCGLRSNVETLVRLARLDLVFPIYEDRAEALKAMRRETAGDKC